MHSMITLETMSDEAFAIWSPRTWASYREEIIRAGMSEEGADENIAQNIAVTMPGGVLAAGQYVFDVRDGATTVGAVWLAERATEWFIYDIEIDAEHQGKGFGREAMRRIEEFVRAHGGRTIGLSVFGFNRVAQRLYMSEGYETTRLSMQKKLD